MRSRRANFAEAVLAGPDTQPLKELFDFSLRHLKVSTASWCEIALSHVQDRPKLHAHAWNHLQWPDQETSAELVAAASVLHEVDKLFVTEAGLGDGAEPEQEIDEHAAFAMDEVTVVDPYVDEEKEEDEEAEEEAAAQATAAPLHLQRGQQKHQRQQQQSRVK